MRVQVDMGDETGEVREFYLREGQDLNRSVRGFCRKYGLEGEDVIAGLEQHIRQQAPKGESQCFLGGLRQSDDAKPFSFRAVTSNLSCCAFFMIPQRASPLMMSKGSSNSNNHHQSLEGIMMGREVVVVLMLVLLTTSSMPQEGGMGMVIQTRDHGFRDKDGRTGGRTRIVNQEPSGRRKGVGMLMVGVVVVQWLLPLSSHGRRYESCWRTFTSMRR